MRNMVSVEGVFFSSSSWTNAYRLCFGDSLGWVWLVTTNLVKIREEVSIKDFFRV